MERIERLRELLAQQSLEALLVSGAENRRYLSGFTGSAGVLIITAEEALLATDFRYFDYANTTGFGDQGFRPDGSVAPAVRRPCDNPGTVKPALPELTLAVEAAAAREMRRMVRPCRCLTTSRAMNGHAPWFSGSYCTHTSSAFG